VPNTQCFSTAEEFGELAGTWPVGRLIEIWSSIPGSQPVKKFTDRKTAVSRIWKGIQSLKETTASQPTPEPEAEQEGTSEIVTPFDDPPAATLADPATLEVEPHEAAAQAPDEPLEVEAPASAPEASAGAHAPDVAPAEAPATTKATRQKKAPTGDPKAKGTREGSKTATILDLMKREGGVTLKAIMEATNWQAHSVRGFISGTLGKKMGLTVLSIKGENGERTYSIKP
jgi:hypothetical protein